jgi:hypothetical protein
MKTSKIAESAIEIDHSSPYIVLAVQRRERGRATRGEWSFITSFPK